MRCKAVPSIELSGNTDEKKIWSSYYQRYQYYQRCQYYQYYQYYQQHHAACHHVFKDREKFSDFKSQIRLEENVLTEWRAVTDTV